GEHFGGISPGSHYRGNHTQSATGAIDNPYSPSFVDAYENPQAVLHDLGICARTFQTPGIPVADHRGLGWSVSPTRHTLFNVLQTPNDKQFAVNGCRFDGEGGDPSIGYSYPASSAHPGGVNVCFADGSVRFIKDSIARLTWWALGTKAGAEVISADSY